MEKEKKIIKERFEKEENRKDKRYYLNEIQDFINELFEELDEFDDRLSEAED